MREAGELAAQQGYLFGLHDNFADMYLDAPSLGLGETVMKGNHVLGGVWNPTALTLGGIWGGAQCLIICSPWGLRYAQRNIPLIMEDIPLSAYFADTLATIQYECYDEEHPLTRADDRRYKEKLLEYLTGLGLVNGSSTAVYWSTPASHLGEGIQDLSTAGVPGIHVPMFSLVYHDSIVSYWHQSDPYNRGEMHAKYLFDILYGYPGNWTFIGGEEINGYEENREELKARYRIPSDLHRRVGLEEMVDHRFMTEDHLVQRTEFGSGTTVYVNFGQSEYTTPEGEAIEPKGYLIKG